MLVKQAQWRAMEPTSAWLWHCCCTFRAHAMLSVTRTTTTRTVEEFFSDPRATLIKEHATSVKPSQLKAIYGSGNASEQGNYVLINETKTIFQRLCSDPHSAYFSKCGKIFNFLYNSDKVQTCNMLPFQSYRHLHQVSAHANWMQAARVSYPPVRHIAEKFYFRHEKNSSTFQTGNKIANTAL